jgi:hypothetical protein
MDESILRPPGLGKLEVVGNIILMSRPVTEAEGQAWLHAIAAVLPADVFTTWSWIPINGYSTKPPEASN